MKKFKFSNYSSESISKIFVENIKRFNKITKDKKQKFKFNDYLTAKTANVAKTELNHDITIAKPLLRKIKIK